MRQTNLDQWSKEKVDRARKTIAEGLVQIEETKKARLHNMASSLEEIKRAERELLRSAMVVAEQAAGLDDEFEG